VSLEAPRDYWKHPEFRAALARFVERVVEKFKPHKIVLFGSFARRNVHQLSDVDVLIVVDTDLEFLQRAGEFKALWDGPRQLQPWVYTPQECSQMLARGNAFLETALREGTVLFEKTAPGCERHLSPNSQD